MKQVITFTLEPNDRGQVDINIVFEIPLVVDQEEFNELSDQAKSLNYLSQVLAAGALEAIQEEDEDELESPRCH